MRIAIVTPVFPNGAETYGGSPLYRTVLALQRLANVEVFCPRLRYPSWRFLQPRNWVYRRVDPSFSPPNVTVHYVEYQALPLVTRPFTGLLCARSLRPALVKYRPEIIIAFCGIYPEGWAAARIGTSLGIPTILGTRGSDLLRIPERKTLKKINATLAGAAFVLTVSEHMRKIAMERGVRSERVRTVHNGIDRSIFYPSDRAKARAELGIAPDAELLLFIGRFIPEKGVPELLDAVLRLVPSHPRIELACIGDDLMGGTLQRQEALASLNGRVRFLGILKAQEVARWLAAADVFCLPSHSEGCPNVVLEALACGRPVVATTVGGIPELVDSSCGILVPPRAPEQLALALAETLTRPWDAAAITARFARSWDDVARETFEVCQNVLQEHSLSTTAMRNGQNKVASQYSGVI